MLLRRNTEAAFHIFNDLDDVLEDDAADVDAGVCERDVYVLLGYRFLKVTVALAVRALLRDGHIYKVESSGSGSSSGSSSGGIVGTGGYTGRIITCCRYMCTNSGEDEDEELNNGDGNYDCTCICQ
jgi:hypothetical protein